MPVPLTWPLIVISSWLYCGRRSSSTCDRHFPGCSSPVAAAGRPQEKGTRTWRKSSLSSSRDPRVNKAAPSREASCSEATRSRRHSRPKLKPGEVARERRGDARCGVARRHSADCEGARRSDLSLRDDHAVQVRSRDTTGIIAADAAKAAGVHLVFTSVGSANRQTGIPHSTASTKSKSTSQKSEFAQQFSRPWPSWRTSISLDSSSLKGSTRRARADKGARASCGRGHWRGRCSRP